MDFGQSANFYHFHASVQKKMAGRLIISLKKRRDILPPGPIMEFGCGTGFLSQELLHAFPNRELILNDVSPKMLDVCRKQIGMRKNVHFEVADAQKIRVEEPAFS